ncbi:HAD-superfamily hydrolase [Clavulina sp. PMI_390]|nr:HAD-superfamily hydrolase [Clavulina sp. PMI_390]
MLLPSTSTTLRGAAARQLGRRRLLHQQQQHASIPQPPPIAFSFDIDGALLRGEHTIPAVKNAFKMLSGDNPWNAKIPFILMTNGGGITEDLRATVLSRQLDFPIRPDQLLQAHTVLKSLTTDAPPGESRANDHVLVLGGLGDAVRTVAESYGFKNVHTPLDILAWNESIWPFHKISSAEHATTKPKEFTNIPISSIFVFHDPRNWALDIQIMCDVIRSYPNGLGGSYPARGLAIDDNGRQGNGVEKQGVQLYFCNPDLLWKARYHVPRFGQGAFKEAFQAVFKAATGSNYPSTQFGKPHKITYDYGARMLQMQSEKLYGIASNEANEPRIHERLTCAPLLPDNPESDIAGANAAKWGSFLVETGVYDPSSGQRPAHEPTEIVTDVEAAVKRGIELVVRGS